VVEAQLISDAAADCGRSKLKKAMGKKSMQVRAAGQAAGNGGEKGPWPPHAL
jgi:hypothetical protein